MDNIFIYYLDLPPKAKGFVRKNEDDSYTIILNPIYSREMQQETAIHELKHIDEDDFNNMLAASYIEFESHKKIEPYQYGNGL